MKKHAAITINHEVSSPSMEHYAKINNASYAIWLESGTLLHRFHEIVKPATT